MQVVVLSGGAGSRLWPISRELSPKPFMHLNSEYSMLEETYQRCLAISSLKGILTVTNANFFHQTEAAFTKSQLGSTSKSKSRYILEPMGKNTAAAITIAAFDIAHNHTEEDVILILPSDHHIRNPSEFVACVKKAESLAKEGAVVVFGIKPTTPETGYGYIQTNGDQFIGFIEKPNLQTAKEFLASKNYLWNSGMFCFTCKTILDEMKTYRPDIFDAAQKVYKAKLQNSTESYDTVHFSSSDFDQIPAESIDYAVMEKSQKISFVSCDMGWNDVGSWTAVSDISQKDSSGNTLKGDVIVHDVSGSYVDASNRCVGIVGLNDIIVVDTPDALLVAHKNSTQDVKNIYNQLKEQQKECHKIHTTVHRPWGSYTILEEFEGYKVKRIEVKPGASLSLQLHKHRSENWIVTHGIAEVVNGEETLHLRSGESTFIPAGFKHRLTNRGEEMLTLIEVQTGSYLGEDDIIRLDDIYGRVENVA